MTSSPRFRCGLGSRGFWLVLCLILMYFVGLGLILKTDIFTPTGKKPTTFSKLKGD